MSQQLNLINPELRPRRDWLAFSVVGPATLAALTLIVAAAAWVRVEGSMLDARERELAGQVQVAREGVQAAAQVLAARSADATLAREAERLQAALQLRREAAQFMQAGGAGSPALGGSAMAAFARQAMEGLWLTGFSASGGELEIRGRMLDPALLPAYIRRLNAEPAFHGRRFAELEMNGVSPQEEAAKATAAALPRYTEFILRTVGTFESGKEGAGK